MPDDLPIDLTKTPLDRDHSKFTLVGGGIASLAAAAFLIRDGDIPGHNITILEESSQLGGSLDAAGSAETGYHLRGGRMFEAHYACTFGLFADIPTLDGSQSVTQETMAWNLTLPTASKSRLMRDGVRQTAPPFGLSEKQILRLAWLLLEPESMLSDSRVQDHVDRDFFTTNFWLLWSTTFAFQPWHSAVEFKRYLLRFAHMTAGLNRLQGILRTRFNQYDSMVRPLQSWLDQRGVRIMLHSRVTDMTLLDRRVTELTVKQHGVSDRLSIGGLDYVLATLGSMTEGASWGDMEHAAPHGAAADGGAWPLWRKIAADRPELGRPETFSQHIDQSRWLSFTVTLRERLLLDLVQKKTGNVAGEGGLITFPDSAWLASIVIPFQPHFIGQPEGASVLWGYGLKVDQPGNFTGKTLAESNGREILTEILGHLGIAAEAQAILNAAICLPCMMPFITSQFLPRRAGDRPQIRPAGWENLALIGQFCELPDDVVFTVEYSIRSAQTAVVALLHLPEPPPAVYRGQFDPRVLYHSVRALHDLPG